VRPNKLIDTVISSALFRLPLFAIASGDRPVSLPERNLLRHLTWSLPSGQSVAREMRISPLGTSELSDLRELNTRSVDFTRSTPLWFYILREADRRAGGLTLGPVGGRIVAEVFIGLLQTDTSSVLFQRDWEPLVPFVGQGFRMIDFLTFAGVAGLR
jgi:hypothetical protein